MKDGEQKFMQTLTTGLFFILRARFAYFKVLRVSSALISAGLMQAEIEMSFYVRRLEENQNIYLTKACIKMQHERF